jgi:hypothetical protein
MLKKPHRSHGWTSSAAAWIARAISAGRASRDWFIQSAILSALRGPIPGIRRSCATSSPIGPGYSTRFKIAPP